MNAMPEHPEAYDGCQSLELHTMADVWCTVSRLLKELQQAGFEGHDLFGLRLALEEVLVNAVKHGNREDPAKKVLFVYHLDTRQFLARVEDEGPGFNPERVPNPLNPENLERPGGRGIFLMRHYMTWIHFNDRGNCVTLCKQKSV